MIMVPVRVVSKSEEGIQCRLGSEPGEEAAVVVVPMDCVLRLTEVPGSDLAVMLLEPGRIPEWLKRALGLG